MKRRLDKTCGRDCPIKPPRNFKNWHNYLNKCGDPPKPYQSWLEFRLFSYGELKTVPYEPETLPYEWDKSRKYTPDGIFKNILIEVKGKFWTESQLQKFFHVRKCHPDKEIIFIFGKTNTKIPDGSMTQEDWATENGFLFFHEKDCILKYLSGV